MMSTLGSSFSTRKLLKGTLAGLLATASMSISMGIGWKLLPRREKYHLPPRLITEEIAERLKVEDKMNEEQLVAATITSHFGYGALFGTLYALFEQELP